MENRKLEAVVIKEATLVVWGVCARVCAQCVCMHSHMVCKRGGW